MKSFVLLVAATFFLMSCETETITPAESNGPGGNTPVYTRLYITRVTVEAYPPTKSDGSAWDNGLAGNYPDVFFSVQDKNQADLYKGRPADRYENLTQAQLPAVWTFAGNGFLIDNFSQGVAVALWDYDSISDNDHVGRVAWNLTGLTAYPTSFSGEYKGTRIRLDVRWAQ